jgi:hypothetical protein
LFKYIEIHRNSEKGYHEEVITLPVFMKVLYILFSGGLDFTIAVKQKVQFITKWINKHKELKLDRNRDFKMMSQMMLVNRFIQGSVDRS